MSKATLGTLNNLPKNMKFAFIAIITIALVFGANHAYVQYKCVHPSQLIEAEQKVVESCQKSTWINIITSAF